MSLLFWLDVAASMLSAVIAMALILIVIGAGARRTTNSLFALFALAGGVWAVMHSVVMMSLGLGIGTPRLWQEFSVLSFGLMPGFLLMFTTRYVNRYTRWADLAAFVGLALVFASFFPPLRQYLVADLALEANGLSSFNLGRWGNVAAGIAGSIYLWSLLLFWRERRTIGGFSLALSVIILLLGLVMRTMLSNIPITSLTAAASIGLMGYSIVSQQLFNPLRELTAELEHKVEERTQQLEAANQKLAQRSAELETAGQSLQEATQRAERRALQIAAGAEIARVATTLLDPALLIPEVVDLIRRQFDFYYVGLFLLDEKNRYAVLQHGAGTGTAQEAGRIMKERGHQLEIGGQSMIGWACANKRARIALDVGEDAVRFENPLTPETRSEMALPLRMAEQVIGALTVQSTQEAAFDDSDISALQGMADQIATALENARLFTQTQATLKELEFTNRLLVREGWQGYLDRAATRRIELGSTGTPATGPLAEPLNIPLELRGQTLGQLKLRREGEQPWTNDEIEMIQTIALQTVLAADNARLVEQTQMALQESEGLYQAAQVITGATELEGICQNLANRVNDMVQADRTMLFLVNGQQKQILLRAGYGNIALDDLQMTYEELSRGISGKVIASGQPILSTSADDGIEPEETRARRKQSGTGPLIVAPLVAKGEVIGTVTVLNRTGQRIFTQHDIDLIMALVAQATIAVENVRLLDATQRRAERERLIRQITTRIRAATGIEGILETTATELAQTMGVPRAIVRLTRTDKT